MTARVRVVKVIASLALILEKTKQKRLRLLRAISMQKLTVRLRNRLCKALLTLLLLFKAILLVLFWQKNVVNTLIIFQLN